MRLTPLISASSLLASGMAEMLAPGAVSAHVPHSAVSTARSSRATQSNDVVRSSIGRSQRPLRLASIGDGETRQAAGDSIAGVVTAAGSARPVPAGVTVNLSVQGSSALVAITTTDAAGGYRFSGLQDAAYVITVPGFASSGGATTTVIGSINNGVAANVNVPVIPPFLFPVGLSQVSIPYDYSGSDTDASQLFGAPITKTGIAYVYTFDAPGNFYPSYPNLPGGGTQTVPGRGYWIWNNTGIPQPFLKPGRPIASPFAFQLYHGWNMIGDPFNNPTPIGQLQFRTAGGGANPGPVLSFSGAVASGMIYQVLLGYDPALGNYGSYTSGDSLQPFRGYWLYVYSPDPLTLIYTNSGP